jgi:hypothetical protein
LVTVWRTKLGCIVFSSLFGAHKLHLFFELMLIGASLPWNEYAGGPRPLLCSEVGMRCSNLDQHNTTSHTIFTSTNPRRAVQTATSFLSEYYLHSPYIGSWDSLFLLVLTTTWCSTRANLFLLGYGPPFIPQGVTTRNNCMRDTYPNR